MKKSKNKKLSLTLACYDWKTIPSDVGSLSQKKRPCYFSNRDQNIFYLQDILKDQLNKYFGGNKIPKVFKNSEYRRSFLFTNCLSWIIFLHNQLAYYKMKIHFILNCIFSGGLLIIPGETVATVQTSGWRHIGILIFMYAI